MTDIPQAFANPFVYLFLKAMLLTLLHGMARRKKTRPAGRGAKNSWAN
jgi:hypothetical protein